eukprot:CAMPEP_0202075840 /NCGR_PEP_ID=MMETSP0964-20121228/4440_1 /ASSEMBLY_ACC=CAM_ASM_000500 /TAXON_ID=4773 /ORGANISM="Schizochytrium aggregatum, Strain ATCC28209" /LENGTH=411 /DNA_ID=CAMNT_0048643045 /DNA_START=48 /DNA_END=1283 /DNA_ORIENTATION=-
MGANNSHEMVKSPYEFSGATAKALAKHGGKPEESSELVRVGVMGTANIAQKHVRAIKPVDGVEVAVVASRSEEKAREFADKFGIPRAVGSYEALLEDSSIDIVYVPLPTALHVEWVTKAAKAKKHILCEKPCALTGKELFDILQVCAENKVAFMDAVMFMHHARLAAICQDLSSGKFGPAGPTSVISNFSFLGDEEFFKSNIRANPSLDALGCLGDLGWYNTRFALFCFGWELPATASGIIHVERDGVPMDMSCTLTWPADKTEKSAGGLPLVRSTTFRCSFLHISQQYAIVAGPDATMRLDDFVIAKSNKETFWQDTTKVEWQNDDDGTAITTTDKTYTVGSCRQESQLWHNFRNCVNATKGGAAVNFWPGVALATQLCMDALLASGREGGATKQVDPENLMESFVQSWP